MRREGVNRMADRLRAKIAASGHAPALDRRVADLRAREQARRDQQNRGPSRLGR